MPKPKKTNKPIDPINDVTQSDKTIGSPTSKPVIITNRPLIKDPMVVDTADDGTTEATDTPAKKFSKPKLQPLNTTSTTGTSDNNSIQNSEADDSTQEALVEDNAEASEKEKSIDKAGADTAERESPKKEDKSPKSPSENSEEIEARRKAEQQANLQKIADAKTYYLPINSVEKKKAKRFVILGILFSLLLIIVWLDVALDAGLIQINGISPLTHFF